MMKKPIQKKPLTIILLILAVGLLNYLSSLTVSTLGIPLFLDSWATSLGVILGGLLVGAFGGVFFNILAAFTIWDPSSWIWSISSIWIAVATYFFLRHNWLSIHKPRAVLGAGLVLGFTNALITFLITIHIFQGLPTYEPTQWLNELIYSSLQSRELAAFIGHLLVELVDKTITLFIAVLIAHALPIGFHAKQKHLKVKKAVRS